MVIPAHTACCLVLETLAVHKCGSLSTNRAGDCTVFLFFFNFLFKWCPGNLLHFSRFPQTFSSPNAARLISAMLLECWMCCWDGTQISRSAYHTQKIFLYNQQAGSGSKDYKQFLWDMRFPYPGMSAPAVSAKLVFGFIYLFFTWYPPSAVLLRPKDRTGTRNIGFLPTC
jgi:hypothetical protein